VITHDQALLQIDAYFAGSLNRDQVRDFHAHISACEDCQLRLRVMRSSVPRPSFTRLGQTEGEAKLQEILRRNRIMVYAVLAILICFFFFFRLTRH
jgi:hypothetical protein